MTKIIRVNSCADCPHKNYGTYCGKDGAISIHYHVFHKKLPKNCPLEEFTENEAFDFLDEPGEDIYTGTVTDMPEAEGEMITFKNK